jgi:hypothetical protein
VRRIGRRRVGTSITIQYEAGPLNFSLSSFLHGDTKDKVISFLLPSLSLSPGPSTSLVPIPCNKHSSCNLTEPSSLNRIKGVLGPIERLRQKLVLPLVAPCTEFEWNLKLHAQNCSDSFFMIQLGLVSQLHYLIC